MDEEIFKDVPRIFLKKYKEDVWNSEPKALYYHQRTVVDTEAGLDEWRAEKILAHKVDSKGVWKFKTLWEGFPHEEATWEPIEHFFHRVGTPLIEYCKKKKLEPPIIKALAPACLEK